MQERSQNRIANSDQRPGLLAPDTSGMNFYRADPALADLLRIHLPEALFRHIEPHLDRLGGLAGGHLDECARLADRHVPVLHQRDRFGRDVQWIEYHPAYRELEHLTGELPPTERAAVVLRYGYDLPYAQIGAALGSSEEAARAAASSGVRRLRRTVERHP